MIVADVQKLRRFGRWNSDALPLRLWESFEQARGLAQAMAVDNSTLRAPALMKGQRAKLERVLQTLRMKKQKCGSASHTWTHNLIESIVDVLILSIVVCVIIFAS